LHVVKKILLCVHVFGNLWYTAGLNDYEVFIFNP